MRKLWVQRVFVGLILAFPLLMSGTWTQSLGQTSAFLPMIPAVLAVEMFLVGGLVLGLRERRRLFANLELVRAGMDKSARRPSGALVGPIGVGKSPAYQTIKR
ncbi:hypothetical protein ACYOEI_30820 [Singulisphaera rosea]